MTRSSPQTVIQQLFMSIQATPDATGSATFSFAMTPNGQTWQGTLNCATAPDTAVFTATAGADNFGTFRGANSWGPIQVSNQQTLSVTATGLIPLTPYLISFIGTATTSGTPVNVYPTAYADSVTTSTEQIFLGGPVAVVPGDVTHATLSPLWRSVWLVASAAGAPTVVGDQSGTSYVPFTPPYLAAPAVFYRFPLITGIDSTVTITWEHTGTAWYGADLASIDTVSYSSSGAP